MFTRVRRRRLFQRKGLYRRGAEDAETSKERASSLEWNYHGQENRATEKQEVIDQVRIE